MLGYQLDEVNRELQPIFSFPSFIVAEFPSTIFAIRHVVRARARWFHASNPFLLQLIPFIGPADEPADCYNFPGRVFALVTVKPDRHW